MIIKNTRETIKPIGVIQSDLSGESRKCWSHPVTDPIPMARMAPPRRVFHVFVASSSIRVPITKQMIPRTPVMIDRVPEKTPWEIAPVIKLIPIYLIMVEKWAREKVIIVIELREWLFASRDIPCSYELFDKYILSRVIIRKFRRATRCEVMLEKFTIEWLKESHSSIHLMGNVGTICFIFDETLDFFESSERLF